MEMPVCNPVSGEALYSLQSATSEQVKAAFAAARRSAGHLEEVPLRQRLEAVRLLNRWLLANREWLLDRIVEESGRCRTDAMVSDLFQLVEDCHWLIRHAPSVLADEKVPAPLSLLGKRCQIQYSPRGVVLVISPWNLPLAIGLTAAMFAFAAGNAVILKPSEHTPMVDVLDQVRGLHPLLEQGLQVVQGDGTVAEQLIDQGPDLIVFTGSRATGRRIMARAAPMTIPVLMELGARDPMIVFDDAPRRRALAAACWGNLHNSGQSCTATEHLFVQEALYQEFARELVDAFSRIRLGTSAEAELGAITTDFQRERIAEQLEDARSHGARILCGGRTDESGRFWLPTLVANVTPAMRIMREETFGPVMTIEAFRDEDEIVARHNAMEVGLSTSVWTGDRARGRRLARRLHTGCINLNNVMLTEGNPGLPFGGVKGSGFGRMKGREGLLGMTAARAVLEDSYRDGPPEPNWYPYSAEKLGLMGRLLDALNGSGPWRWWRLLRVGMAIERLRRRG